MTEEIRHPFLIPDDLGIKLQQMGLDEDIVMWQHATDFLRNKFNTHVIVHPVDVVEGKGAVLATMYDYTLISPFGEDYEKDIVFSDYYLALEEGIRDGIDCIEEGPATEPVPEERKNFVSRLFSRMAGMFEPKSAA